MYRLNSAAACIWRNIERHPDPTSAAKGIAENLAIDEATALTYLRTMLCQWTTLKLLSDGRPKRGERLIRRKPVPSFAQSEILSSPATICRRQYAVLGTIVSVDFAERRLEESVHPTLLHLEVAAQRAAEMAIQIRTSPAHYELWCDGHRLGTCVGTSRLAA